jgi:RND family efflux transporter MFP subunit
MAKSKQASILDRIRGWSAESGGISDAELLKRFAGNCDESAFELLLWRHAQLVFGVCLRVLKDVHDAEDAFQATFLALARNAANIVNREAAVGWLYRVAYRVALTSLRRRNKCETREQPIEDSEPAALLDPWQSSAETRELRAVLDQEVGNLPARFRSAVVLCYLEGKSVDEAAVLLGCPRGTVASRLARGRERLRVRLVQRGLAVLAALELLSQAPAAQRPLALIPKLSAAAVKFAGGPGALEHSVSPRITALTEEVLRAMFLHKLRSGVIVFVALLGLLFAGGVLTVGLQANAGPDADPPRTGAAPKESAEKKLSADEKDTPKGVHKVTISHPIRREATVWQEYSGRLGAISSVEVRPAVGGFVLKVCFNAGDVVKKGAVLFELDSRAANLAVDKAQAELEVAVARMKERAGSLSEAQHQNVEGRNSVAEFAKAKAQLAIAEAGVQAARVEVSRARLESEATRVTSPISGKVSRSLVSPGSLVFRGQDNATVMTKVSSTDRLEVTFAMDQSSYNYYERLIREKQIKGNGDPIRLRVGDEDFDRKAELTGFDDHVNPANGTVIARAILPNPGQDLLPGTRASVHFPFGPRNVLEVPRNAVRSKDGKRIVAVVDDSNHVRWSEVTVRMLDNDMFVIDKGLRDEDWIVLDGPEDLKSGDLVETHRKHPSDDAKKTDK